MEWQTVFRFSLAALAGWRVAFLLARETGPWQILLRFRQALGAGLFGQLFSCVKCLGIWISIPFAFFVGGTWKELLVIWLALAGVTALIDEWTRPPFEWQETPQDELLRQDNDGSTD
jgi:hypothetical protein